MKKVYIFYSAIVAIIATQLGSCRPEPIPIQLPPEEGSLVVASQIIPNKTMIVALSRTFNALVNTDTTPGSGFLEKILVSHALVTVDYNGKTDTLNKISNGFYGTFTTPLMENVVYTLRVHDSTTGREVTAETRVMPRITLDSVYVVTEIIGLDTLRTLNVKFKDPVGDNYYMVNIYRNADFFVDVVNNPISIFQSQGSSTQTIPLSDKLFQGKLHTYQSDISGWFAKDDTLTLTLSMISADYYEYLVQKRRAERNGLAAFFGEPVNYTTNVRPGYGFFTAHWPDARVVVIKE